MNVKGAQFLIVRDHNGDMVGNMIAIGSIEYNKSQLHGNVLTIKQAPQR